MGILQNEASLNEIVQLVGKDALGAGDQLTLEWGLGKSFGAVSAGLVGYSQWQTTNDSGAGASANKAARHAVGAELVYPIPGAGVFLKGAYYKEVNVKAGSGGAEPKGSMVRFTLVKAF